MTVLAGITADEIRLVREQGEVLVTSHEQPGAARQPYEWHDGKTLIALADKLANRCNGTASESGKASAESRSERSDDVASSASPIGVTSMEFGDITTPDRTFRLLLHFVHACSTAEELGYRVVVHEFRNECGDVAGFQADASRAAEKTP